MEIGIEIYGRKTFNNSQKFVDRGLTLWDIDPTHGNNNRHYEMRTKTLLTAVAALAAGITISNAQVYSANVVGYASVPTINSGSYYMLNVPFAIGASNGANEVFGNNLPDFTQILTWSDAQQKFTATLFDSTEPVPGVRWYQGDDFTPAIIPTLPPGRGFYIVPAGPVTNLFSGSVAVNVGATNTVALNSSGAYYMLGSAVPYSGVVTNGSLASGGINLNNLPDFTQVLTWNPNTQKFVVSLYDSTQPVPGVNWYQGDDFTPQPAPTLGVGEGFFLVPADVYTWKQVLPAN